jgi:hypothetical protein
MTEQDLKTAVEDACKRARQKLAAGEMGPYGGLYVGRMEPTGYPVVVLDHDDPELVPDDVDVIAQVTPAAVYGIGRARSWLNEDGTVVF